MDEPGIKAAFGKVLKKLREERGISQEKLAFEIEGHFSHVSRLENGRKQPTLTTLYKIAKVLQVTPSFILSQVDELLDEKTDSVN